MIERKLIDSIGDSKNIITSGKGGVGKSTTSAAISLYFSDKAEKVISVDMDAAHSLGDSLGMEIDQTKEGTFSMDYNDNLKLYFLSQIIPDIYNDPNHKELNEYLDSLLDIDDSFLPLLRLAIHPNFAGMPLPHENAAYVLQLLELFRKNTIYDIEGKSLIREVVEGKFDRRIIDSENTKGLVRVINSVLSIQKTLENINGAFYGTTVEKLKKTSTKVGISSQANLLKLAKSDLIRDYKRNISDVVDFHSEITRASVVIVTQPGYNDLHQTIREVEQLDKMGFLPKHILVNKYKQHFDKDPHATEEIYNELKNNISDKVGISKVDSEFHVIDPSLSEEEKQELIKNNLKNISDTFY